MSKAMKDRPATRQNMGDTAGLEIIRTWGDVPVVDAKKDLRVFMTPEDLKGARIKDPSACVFARACRRMFHATKVLIFRTVAYVELPNEDGSRRVERFVVGPAMRDLIEAFDRGEGVIPSAGFTLRAPPKSETLEGLRKEAHRQLQRQRKDTRPKLIGRARQVKVAASAPITPASKAAASGGAAPRASVPTSPASRAAVPSSPPFKGVGPPPNGLGQGRGKYRDDPLYVNLELRSGSGAVHFASAKPPREARRP
jgi:hypothetical protein